MHDTRLRPLAFALLLSPPLLAPRAAGASVREGYARPVLAAPYATVKPVIDGVIGDAEWRGAASVNALQTTGKQVSPRQTRFWIGWDEEHLYVAMRSPLRPGERVIQNFRDTTRDINVVFDDSYEIWVDVGSRSPDGQPVFFQYLANFAGGRYDVMHEPAVGNSRLGWTAGWNPRNRITGKNEWEMEVAIPRASLHRETPFADGEAITFLLARNFKKPWEQNSFEGTGSFSVLDTHTRVTLSKTAPAIHLLQAADPQAQTFGLAFAAYSPAAATVAWRFDSDGGVSKSGTAALAPGALTTPQGLALDWDRVPANRETSGAFRIRVASADGSQTYLDWASSRQFGNLKTLALDKPDSDDRISVSLALNPVNDYVRVTGDFIDYANRAAVGPCEVTVSTAAGKTLARERYTLDELAYVRGVIRLPDLAEGTYAAKMTVFGKDGAVLREAENTFTKADPARKFAWWNTRAGNIETVVPPWTPMTVKQNEIGVWGRSMTVGAAGLPQQIVSQGAPLLAAPARLVAVLPGGAAVEAKGRAPRVVSRADHRVVAESRASLAGLAVASRVTAEFDGMYKVELTLDPGKQPVAVDALRLVLPLDGARASYVYGAGEGIRSGYYMGFLPRERKGRIWDCRTVDSQPMVVGSFIPYVWVGTPDAGLCWFADSDKGWVPHDATPAIELVRGETSVDLVLNLISDAFVIDAPRTIVFAFQASPAKPLTGSWRMNTWWCGDTFDWGGGGWVYPDGKGSTIWQSRPNTTKPELCRSFAEKRQRGRFRYTPEGPERRANVVPYFEYNTMADGGEQAYFGEAWKASSGPLWYGKPLTDYIVWNLDQWIKSCNIDGWYLDNVRPVHCDNLDAGRGYRLPDGRVQPEFNLFIMRDFFLRLRAVFHENKGASCIVNHMTNNMLLPWNAPVDIAYDGEHHVIYPEMGKDFMDFWSLERLFTCNPGMWGVNVNFMNEYQGRWEPEARRRAMRAYSGAVMLHDALPTGNSATDRDQRAILAARDRFGIDTDDVSFIGYWKPDSGLACTTKDVYLAGWLKPGRLLLGVVNWGGAADAAVTIDAQKLGLPAACRAWDAEQPGTALAVAAGGALTVPVNRHDFRLIIVEPDER